jgi:hypothetical protein
MEFSRERATHAMKACGFVSTIEIDEVFPKEQDFQ